MGRARRGEAAVSDRACVATDAGRGAGRSHFLCSSLRDVWCMQRGYVPAELSVGEACSASAASQHHPPAHVRAKQCVFPVATFAWYAALRLQCPLDSFFAGVGGPVMRTTAAVHHITSHEDLGVSGSKRGWCTPSRVCHVCRKACADASHQDPWHALCARGRGALKAR